MTRTPKEPAIGAEYFSLYIDEETGAHEWWIYRVRTIQNRNTISKHWHGILPNRFVRYIYAVQVNEWTWGKRSTKSGDYGWLPRIHPTWRKKWRADEEPRDLFKTKKAALRAEIAQYHPENYDNPDIAAKVLTKLNNMLKRC